VPDRPRSLLNVTRLRVPLPAKLLGTYALLLAVAAVPTFVYVRAHLESDLVGDASRELQETAQMTATVLMPLSPADREARAADLARMTGDRVTLFGPASETLFDSAPALGADPERTELRDAIVTGKGIAVRTEGGADSIFAAARIGGAAGTPAATVRIAHPLAAVRAATEGLTSFSRNTEAAALSLAFFLSVLAAARFQRPLQRVVATAKALGAGDLAARSGVSSNDEVGDAGRALDAMAAEIRRRLANAGSADAVIAQLVDALPIPCVIFEVSGEVLALNGASRTALRVEGPNASRRLKELTASERFESALQAAEGDGEPEPIDVEIAPGSFMRGTVHVLKRPGVAPLYVLLGGAPARPEATTLPAVEALLPRLFVDVMKEAEGASSPALTRAGVDLEMSASPDVLIVDVGHRVHKALVAALSASALSLQGRSSTLAVDVKVDDTSVRLGLECDPGKDAVAAIRPLLEPIGGGVRVDSERATTLWIPRA
jgi:HAMP domain-containing protein